MLRSLVVGFVVSDSFQYLARGRCTTCSINTASTWFLHVGPHRQSCIVMCFSKSHHPLFLCLLRSPVKSSVTLFTRFHFATTQAQTLTTFQPYSKYPPCYKDVTFWLPEENFHNNDLFEVVRDVAGDLVEEVTIFCQVEYDSRRTYLSRQARP